MPSVQHLESICDFCCIWGSDTRAKDQLYIGLSPCPVTVTPKICSFWVGNPSYKLLFATGILGGGDNPNYRCIYIYIHTPEIEHSPLKNDAWKMSFLLGLPIFRGCVKFLGCNHWSDHFPCPKKNSPVVSGCDHDLCHEATGGKPRQTSVEFFLSNRWVKQEGNWLGTIISPYQPKFLKMMFLFSRWDMLL